MGYTEQSDPTEESVLKSEAPKQPEESLSTEKCDSSTEAATGYDEQQISINKTVSGLEAPKDMETYSFEECGSLVIEHPALDSVLGPMRESEETLDGSDFERQCCLVINSPVRSGDALVDECVFTDQDAVGESCRVETEYRAAAINCLSAPESDPEYEKLSEVECGLNQIFLNEINLKDEAFVSNLKPVSFSRLASQGHSVPITAAGVKEDVMFSPYNNINLYVEGIKESVMDLNDATKTLDVGMCDTTSSSLPNSSKCCKNTGSGDLETPLLETNSENSEKDQYVFADKCFPQQSSVFSAGHAYAPEKSCLFPMQRCDTEMVVGSGSTRDMVREETCKSNGILQGNNSVALADISFYNERSWSAHIGDADAMESNEALSSLRRSSGEKKLEKASNRKKAMNKTEDLLSATVRRKRRCLKRSVRISSWGLTESLSKYIKLNAGAVDHLLGIVKSGGKSRKKQKVHVNASSHGLKSKSRKHASSGQVSLKLKLVRKGKNTTESDPLIGTDLQEKLSIGSDDRQLDLSKGIKDVTQRSSNKSSGANLLDKPGVVADSVDKDLEDALVPVKGSSIGGNDLLGKKAQRHFNSSTSPDSEVIHALNSQTAHKVLEVHHNSTQASLDNRPPAMPKMRKKKEKKEKICQLGDSDVQNRLLCSSIIGKTEIPEKCGDNSAKSIIDARLGALCESVDSLNSTKLLPSAEASGNRKSKGLKSKEKTTVKSKAVSATTLKNGNSRKVKGDKWKLMGKYSIGENGVSDFAHQKEDNQEAEGKCVMDESVNKADIAMRGSAYEGLTSMPAVHGIAVQQISHPRTAWVCCDDCVKWRCISANLADIIDETNCRWTCKDNQDKAFADCSVPQEMSNAEINADLNISGDEDGSGVHISGKYYSTKQSAVPQQSSWMLIKSNIFLHRSRNSQTLDEVMVCHCKFSSDGKLGCGDECLNRMLNIECVQGTCPCGELCSNQQFQRQNYANLKWFRSGKKGYGLQVLEDIAEGKFLIEYVGEVLDLPAYEARQRVYASKGHKHFYFMTLNGNEVIDACAKGNLGRFINHSCDPNCRTEKWMVNGEICIGLFAVRDIKKGEELTFDYNYVRVFGAAAKKCYCASPQCRGYIGGDRLDNEAVDQSDSDEEFPEPVVLYENGEIADVKTMMSEFSSLDVIKEKKLQTEAEILSDGKDITNKLEDVLTSVGGQLHSSEEDRSIFGTENVDKTRLNIQQEITGPSLQASLNKPVDAECNRSAVEITGEKATQSKVRPRMKISRPFESGKSKEFNECGSGATVDKDMVTSKKSQGAPNKLKKLVESSAKHHLETVEDKLNELLDDAGGICKRKDASRGYLKLLVLTAASGDCNHHEAIQSNRDLSMILDAILKTKSRTVLTDILNKNGLQMLHSMVKKCRGNFNMIPILRKLLKVFEFLAERMILDLEHINGGPPRPGVESFRDSILSLTEHEDWKVHQTARNFRDKWIPRPLKKYNCVERGASNGSRFEGSHEHLNDRDMLEGPCDAAVECLPNTVQIGERRKRKSRWDQSPEVSSPHGVKKDEVMQEIEEDAPPGFSCPAFDAPHPSSEQYPGPLKCPSQIPLGNAQQRFNSCLPVAYGIPFNYVQKFGTPQASTVDHWVIAPGMPFRPFPPLPLTPPREAFNGCLTAAAKHTDQGFPGSSTASPLPPVSTTNSHLQQYKGPFNAQRRPFQQRRNCFRRPPWGGFNRNRNGSGHNFPNRPPGAPMATTFSDRNEHPENANNFMG